MLFRRGLSLDLNVLFHGLKSNLSLLWKLDRNLSFHDNKEFSSYFSVLYGYIPFILFLQFEFGEERVNELRLLVVAEQLENVRNLSLKVFTDLPQGLSLQCLAASP